MRTVVAIFLFACSVMHADGADLTWPDGTVWHDIRFVTWDQQTVTLAHDGTTTQTLIRTLPGEARWQIHLAQAAAIRDSAADQEELHVLGGQAIHFFGALSQITSRHTAMAAGVEQWREERLEIELVGELPADAVDGTKWDGWIWPAGRVQFTDGQGVLHTVARFATSPELALAFRRSD